MTPMLVFRTPANANIRPPLEASAARQGWRPEPRSRLLNESAANEENGYFIRLLVLMALLLGAPVVIMLLVMWFNPEALQGEIVRRLD